MSDARQRQRSGLRFFCMDPPGRYSPYEVLHEYLLSIADLGDDDEVVVSVRRSVEDDMREQRRRAH